MNARWARDLVALALPLLTLRCSLISLDDLSSGAVTSSSTGGAGAAAQGGGGDMSTSSNGASGGAGGSGGTGGRVDPRDELVDQDLLIRCYLDEAESGLAPIAALDYAPEPLDLPLQVGPLTYATIVGNRGLSWPSAELAGGPTIPVAGTKIESVDGLKQATLETVVNVTAASVFNSRIIHMGSFNDSGRLTMNVVAPVDGNPMLVGVAMRQEGATVDEVVARFDVDLANFGRVVLHAVVDLDQALENDRVRLYLNGSRLTRFDGFGTTASVPITLGDINENLIFMLGNRFIGDRSFAGTLFYGALYTSAFSEAQVQQNATALLAGDDASKP